MNNPFMQGGTFDVYPGQSAERKQGRRVFAAPAD